jgi:hypothetical protein
MAQDCSGVLLCARWPSQNGRDSWPEYMRCQKRQQKHLIRVRITNSSLRQLSVSRGGAGWILVELTRFRWSSDLENRPFMYVREAKMRLGAEHGRPRLSVMTNNAQCQPQNIFNRQRRIKARTRLGRIFRHQGLPRN